MAHTFNATILVDTDDNVLRVYGERFVLTYALRDYLDQVNAEYAYNPHHVGSTERVEFSVPLNERGNYYPAEHVTGYVVAAINSNDERRSAPSHHEAADGQ